MTIYQDGPKGLVGYKIGLGSSNCEVLSHNVLCNKSKYSVFYKYTAEWMDKLDKQTDGKLDF